MQDVINKIHFKKKL